MDVITTIATTLAPDIATFQHNVLWALIIGAILAFMLGFGMGANDVANAFGTSVGSKALGLKTAYFLATIFETLGAVLVGYNVTDTMRKMVVDIDLYQAEPKTLLIGQVAILGGASVWLFIATFSKLPVSTTHSVVGATLGFSLVMKGFHGIMWRKVGEIVASWLLSPLLSGTVSSLLYLLVDHVVLRRSDPMRYGLRALPVFYFFCLAFNSFAVSYQGSKILHLSSLPLWLAFLISVIVGLIAALAFHFIARPRIIRWIENTVPETPTRSASGTTTHSDDCASRSDVESGAVVPMGGHKVAPLNAEPVKLGIAPAFVTDDIVGEKQRFTTSGFRAFFRWFLPARQRVEHARTLKLFSSIQVFTACFAGFAHGANDVSNAIAPLAAIYAIFRDMSVDQKEDTPIYVLLYGVGAICVGLWLLGHRVIRTVGQEMSEIHPASGFCIEFGAAVTALLASKIGLPISTTHCLVGSVVAVGTVKSGEGIDWRIFRNIALSWVVTLPVSGVISALIMLLLKLTL